MVISSFASTTIDGVGAIDGKNTTLGDAIPVLARVLPGDSFSLFCGWALGSPRQVVKAKTRAFCPDLTQMVEPAAM